MVYATLYFRRTTLQSQRTTLLFKGLWCCQHLPLSITAFLPLRSYMLPFYLRLPVMFSNTHQDCWSSLCSDWSKLEQLLIKSGFVLQCELLSWGIFGTILVTLRQSWNMNRNRTMLFVFTCKCFLSLLLFKGLGWYQHLPLPSTTAFPSLLSNNGDAF